MDRNEKQVHTDQALHWDIQYSPVNQAIFMGQRVRADEHIMACIKYDLLQSSVINNRSLSQLSAISGIMKTVLYCAQFLTCRDRSQEKWQKFGGNLAEINEKYSDLQKS